MKESIGANLDFTLFLILVLDTGAMSQENQVEVMIP